METAGLTSRWRASRSAVKSGAMSAMEGAGASDESTGLDHVAELVVLLQLHRVSRADEDLSSGPLPICRGPTACAGRGHNLPLS